VTVSRTTRVVEITAPRTVAVVDRIVPSVGAGQVLIRSVVSGISAGTEMNVYRGAAPQWHRSYDLERRLFVTDRQPDFAYPIAYGYANVARVEELGPETEDLGVGDLVFSFSPHREWSVVDAEALTRLPALRRPEHGVLVANLNTALNGVLDARPPITAAVVVSGLGVIGQLVVQLLVRTGAGYIGAIDPAADRQDLATLHGATEVFAPGPAVAEAVRARTGNRGADIVIEVSGSPAGLAEAIRIVGPNGVVIAMSWYSGSFASLDLSGEFHHNRVQIRSSQVDEVNPFLGPLWSNERRMAAVLDLLNQLDLDPLFTHRYPIEEAAEAYRCVDDLRDGLIQCVLTYPEVG
jgi:2-desacetyl-2-hydroxyethyl bacteriochlorophyllide A dehydrogenase